MNVADIDRGTKCRDILTVPGTDIVLPITRICGNLPGQTLLVTGGVHGGEYPGIEAAIRFAAGLDAERLRGAVVVVHLSNPLAFFAKSQYVVPQDGKNLNRVFPGKATGTMAERIAYAIATMAQEADYWVDLHGGDLHEALVPFAIYSDQGRSEVVEQARAMAEAYGIPYILESSAIGGGTYTSAARMGIPAILTEAGQVGQLDEEAVQIHLDGLENILRALGFVPEALAAQAPSQIFRQFMWTNAPETGLFYRAITAGQWIKKGDKAGQICNPYGDKVAEIQASQDGVVLFVATSLAINQGDPLFAVAAP